jgi:exonuclease SbcD
MRIMHTSDWHLGKSIHGVNLDSDQRHAVDLITKELLDGGYRAVIIAGDIFDRSIPPTSAIEMLSGFLDRVSAKGIDIVIVPGNHDNPERLNFASEIMEHHNVHLRCRYEGCDEPILIEGYGEKVQIFCLPFVEDAELKALYPEQGIMDHSSAVDLLVSMMRGKMAKGVPSILVAHEYTGRDVVSSESERELLLGDQGRVPSEIFSGFDYVALGHLHGPQTASAEHNACYSGSILQYSFTECDHEKGVISISVEGGKLSWEKVPIRPLKRMVLIEDSLDNILEDPKYDVHMHDYVGVRLTHTGPRFDIQTKLRERFPNLMDTSIVQLAREGPDAEQVLKAIDSPKELFSLFLDKFGWDEMDRREKALSYFEEARKKAEHSFRRGCG